MSNRKPVKQVKSASYTIKKPKKPTIVTVPDPDLITTHFSFDNDGKLSFDEESKLCKEIIKLYFKNESKADADLSTSSMLYLSAHGSEKTIRDIEDCSRTDSIINHIIKTYKVVNIPTIDNIMRYIEDNIKISTMVPSGEFGAFVPRCYQHNDLSTREWEIKIIKLYMNGLLEIKGHNKITNNDMNNLFTIIRNRLRYLFKAFYENNEIDRTTTDYEENHFQKYIKNSANNDHLLEEGIWKDYNLDGNMQNKTYSFKPNEDEIEMDAKYGPTNIIETNDGIPMSKSYNLLETSLDESFRSSNATGTRTTFISNLINLFSNNNNNNNNVTTDKKNSILAFLKVTKKLTLADIIYLGFILNIKLFLFDPSCNYCDNRTRGELRSGTFYGERGHPYIYPNGYKVAFVDANKNESQINEESPGSYFGGKKNRRKTRKRKSKKRSKKSKRTKRKM